jgi:hypothetical protein
MITNKETDIKYFPLKKNRFYKTSISIHVQILKLELIVLLHYSHQLSLRTLYLETADTIYLPSSKFLNSLES